MVDQVLCPACQAVNAAAARECHQCHLELTASPSVATTLETAAAPVGSSEFAVFAPVTTGSDPGVLASWPEARETPTAVPSLAAVNTAVNYETARWDHAQESAPPAEPPSAAGGWSVRGAQTASVSPAAPAGQAGPPPVAMPWEHGPIPRGRGGRMVALAALSAAVAVGGWLWIARPGPIASLIHRDHVLVKPRAISGLDLTPAPAVVGAIQSQVARTGATEAVIGVYRGAGGTGSLILVVVRGPSPDGSLLARAVGRQSTAADNTATVRRTVDGIEYACSPLNGGEGGATCAWNDDDIHGQTITSGGDLDVALSEATQARALSEQ